MATFIDIEFATLAGDDDEKFCMDLYLPSAVDSSGQDITDYVHNGKKGKQHRHRLDHIRKHKTERIPHKSYVDTETRDMGYETGEKHTNDCVFNETLNDDNSIILTKHTEDEGPNDDVKGTKPPLVIFVHGGGWRRGGREAWTHFLYTDVNLLVALIHWFANTYKNVGESLAERGIACAVISYPLTELGLPYLLLELFISYVQCCLLVLVSVLPFYGILSLYRHASYSTNVYLHAANGMPSGKLLALSLLTNVVILVLFTKKRQGYRLNKFALLTLWSVNIVAFLVIRTWLPDYSMQVTCLVTFLSTQFVILIRRLKGTRISYSDQVSTVAQSVKWARKFGRRTGHVDGNRIYLMGHSAGAHLVSLIALDETHLQNAGCRISHIKGVISVSGVYDLMCINSPFLRQFYLQPTFGNSDKLWYKASPKLLVRKSNNSRNGTTSNTNVAKRPMFLVMSAELDLFLKEQSYQFADELRRKGFHYGHVEIPKTNHFSIITKLEKHGAKSVVSHIAQFIFGKNNSMNLSPLPQINRPNACDLP